MQNESTNRLAKIFLEQIKFVNQSPEYMQKIFVFRKVVRNRIFLKKSRLWQPFCHYKIDYGVSIYISVYSEIK